MTLSLWTEASRDLDAETSARRMANAKVAVAGFWPFLSLAQSETEFDHRLALASDHIANAVPTDLLQPIEASLREDYRLLHTAVDPKMLMSDGPYGGGVDFGAGAPKGGDGVNPADLQMDMGAGGGAGGGGGASSGTPGGTAPAGGSAPGANTPQQPDPNSTNTPMTARLLTEGIRGPETGAGAGFGGTDTGSGVSAPGGGMVQGPNSQDNPNLPAGPTPPAGGAPPGGSAPGGNTPQPGAPGGGGGAGVPGAPSPQDTQMSMNTPMTTQGAKDTEGEDDDDGKPPWLKDKIKKKKGAYWHAGAQRWVAARVGTDPEDHPTRREADEDAQNDRPAPWVDPDTLGESYQDPWRVPKKTSAAFFHHGQQRWVTAAVEEGSGGGNPDYFTGGPEAGPNTGQTGQYPMHPTGADPEDGINGMFPMQPSPWTAGEPWKEVPMNFSPPNGNQRAAGRQVLAEYDEDGYDENGKDRYGFDRHVKEQWDREHPGPWGAFRERGRDGFGNEIAHQGSRHPFLGGRGGNTTSHRPGDDVEYYQSIHDDTPRRATVIYGANSPDYGNHYKVRLPDGGSDLALHEYTHKVGASAGDTAACDSCPNPIKRVKTSWGGAWTHTGSHGAAADDDHEPHPRSSKVDKRQPRSDSPHHRYTMPATGRRVTAEEGVEGRPGPNPEFFSGGAEGVSGDQGGGFPADESADEQDRINELFGANPISGGFFDPSMAGASQTTGSRRRGTQEFDRLPDPELDSSEERERYRIAQSDTEQQGNRSSFTGSRRVTDERPKVSDEGRVSDDAEDHDKISPVHPRKRKERGVPEDKGENVHKHRASRFYDPGDPGVHMVAAFGPPPPDSSLEGDPDKEDTGESDFGDENLDDSGSLDEGGSTPQTTPPRQLPSEGGGEGGDGENPFEDGPPGEDGDPNITGGEGGQHPGSDLPEGSGSDMVGQGGDTPTDTEDPSAEIGKKVSYLWYQADQSGLSYDRPDDSDPTGAGDDYLHRTWNGPMQTRPRQDADDRKANTPQRPGQPIPTVSSPGSPGDPEQQKEASRVGLLVTQGLGGGW